jgi:hypothetical protein
MEKPEYYDAFPRPDILAKPMAGQLQSTAVWVCQAPEHARLITQDLAIHEWRDLR